MAKIFILHSRENDSLIRSLMNNLSDLGHEIVLSDFEIGHDINTSIKNAMQSADIQIALIGYFGLTTPLFSVEIAPL